MVDLNKELSKLIKDEEFYEPIENLKLYEPDCIDGITVVFEDGSINDFGIYETVEINEDGTFRSSDFSDGIYEHEAETNIVYHWFYHCKTKVGVAVGFFDLKGAKLK